MFKNRKNKTKVNSNYSYVRAKEYLNEFKKNVDVHSFLLIIIRLALKVVISKKLSTVEKEIIQSNFIVFNQAELFLYDYIKLL